MQRPAVSPQEFLHLGGRLTHIRDPQNRGGRVVTIAYWVDEKNNALYYGATIFRPSLEEPVFTHKIRKGHNQTAVNRLYNAPVIESDPFGGFTGEGQVEYHRRVHIRDRIMDLGCSDLENEDIDVHALMLWAASE